MTVAAVCSSATPTTDRSIQNALTLWRSRLVKVYYHHSDLVSQYSRLGLNSIVLIGKLSTTIPQAIPRAAQVWLSYTGIAYTNIMIRDMLKSARDVRFAYLSSDYPGMIFTAIRTAVKVTNIALTFGLFVASVIALGGYPAVATAIYMGMRPIALIALVLGISDEFIDFAETKSLLESLPENDPPNLMGHFSAYALDMPLDEEILKDATARCLVRDLEESCLGVFQAHPDKLSHCYLEVRKAVQQKLSTTIENLYARIFGYFSMAICRMFPDSLIQASLIWGISLYYTEKMVREKLRNIKRERRLELMPVETVKPRVKKLSLDAQMTIRESLRIGVSDGLSNARQNSALFKGIAERYYLPV